MLVSMLEIEFLDVCSLSYHFIFLDIGVSSAEVWSSLSTTWAPSAVLFS